MSLSPAAPALVVPLPNSYWVLPGRLLAGEHPGGGTAEVTRERLARLLESGIDCFIDLTQPHELLPYESALPPGVQYLRCPIVDHGTPANFGDMVEILGNLERFLREARVIYLHCRAGIGRTGMVAGIFFGLAFGMGSVGAAVLGKLADQVGVNLIYQICAFLPLIGLLAAFLPDVHNDVHKPGVQRAVEAARRRGSKRNHCQRS